MNEKDLFAQSETLVTGETLTPHETPAHRETLAPEETLANTDTAKASEESQLDKPITLSLLLKFGLPTIFAMLVMHTFAIVDGIFAMRVLSWEAMSAITVFMPVFLVTAAIGMIFAAGSAVIVKKTGMKLYKEARQNFTFVCLIAFLFIVSVTVAIVIFPSALLNILGANYEIYDLASTYLRIAAWSFPFMTMSQIFNLFLIADGKPTLSMGISVLGTLLGAGGNALFLFVFEWGMEGLAWATLVGTVVPAVIYFFLFCSNRKGTFYFARPKIDLKSLGSILLLGMAVFIPSMTAAATLLLMNNVLVRMDGVGAMGIAVAGMVMAVHGTLSVLFLGHLQGTGALISFNHGKANHDRQKRLFRLNIKIFALISVFIIIIAMVFSDLLMRIYMPSTTDAAEIFMREIAVRGLRIISLSFLVSGFNMFAAGQFTALSKGAIATTLNTLRTLGFNLPLLLLLPRAFDLTGVWMAMPIAEGLTIILSIIMLLKFGKRYNFLGREEGTKKHEEAGKAEVMAV